MNYQQLIISESTSNFRALARQGLGGRWNDAIAKGFIYSLIIYVPTAIIGILSLSGYQSLNEKYTSDIMAGRFDSSVLYEMLGKLSNYASLVTLFDILVMGALTFGITSVYLRYRRGQEAPHSLLFDGFSRFGKCLLLYLVMSIFIFLWTLLFIVPGIIAMYRYRLAWYVLIDNPEVGVLEAITISKTLMRGNKFSLFCLDLSFIGWALLTGVAVYLLSTIAVGAALGSGVAGQLVSAIVQGILMTPVLMYHGTSTAAFYERASGLLKYTDEVGQPVNTNTPPAPPQA